MAGLLYLPRLFVYHSTLEKNDKAYNMFCTMEKKLLNYIMHPSMITVIALGVIMILDLEWRTMVWLHYKLVLVLLLIGIHFWYLSLHKKFLHENNQYSERFYRIINEIPAVIMVIVVLLAVLKP